MSECQCSCVYDYESPGFYWDRIVRARKTHKCDECGEFILPGEHYEKVSGMWDGYIDTYKTCVPCMRIRNDLCKCGFIHGELRVQIKEDLGFDYVTYCGNGEES